MRTGNNITVDMIPEHEYSVADSLKVKALIALELMRKGMSKSAVYTFCRIAPQDVEQYEEQFDRIHDMQAA